jgi:hypothetical protein
MKIRFLGTPIEQIDQLIAEEEIVMVSIQTFKMEELGHIDGSTTMERVQTGGWGIQIRSSKDLIQFVDDKEDEYNAKSRNVYNDETLEKFR